MKIDDKVYGLVARIPEGRVTTYAELARAVGKPRASRMIGRILNRNPNPIIVPCYRVVKSDGCVGGYAYGAAAKRRLLEKEGIQITKDRIADFEKRKCKFTKSLLP